MPKFYSTADGALCTRYGTGTYIGASISVVNGATAIKWDTREVVAITDEEFAKYSREYLGMVKDGSLVEREQKDFERWNTELEASEKKAFADLEPAAAAAPSEAANTPASTAAKTES